MSEIKYTTTKETNMRDTNTLIPVVKNPEPRKRAEMHSAQLYWDDQDPSNVGWVLRYRDEDGTEQAFLLEAEAGLGATYAELADLVARDFAPTVAEIDHANIKVHRGGCWSATITIRKDAVVGYRVHS